MLNKIVSLTGIMPHTLTPCWVRMLRTAAMRKLALMAMEKPTAAPLVVKTEQAPDPVLAAAGRARLRLSGWWLLPFVTGAVLLSVAFGVVA